MVPTSNTRPPPWRDFCRVKQRWAGSVSAHAWQLPMLLNLWLALLGALLLLAMDVNNKRGSTSVGPFIAAVLAVLVCPLSLVWLKLAVQHYKVSADRTGCTKPAGVYIVTSDLPSFPKSSSKCCGVLCIRKSSTTVLVLSVHENQPNPLYQVAMSVVCVLVILRVLFLLLLLAGDVERNPGPTRVTENRVDQLAGLLDDIAANWYLLLVQLGVSPSVREQTRIGAIGVPNPSRYCLTRGLHEWVKSDREPTYEKIIHFLNDQHKDLAKQVQQFASQGNRNLTKGEQLGRGSYGYVHEMLNASGDVECAGKFFYTSETDHNVMEKERKVLSKLRHQNIVQYIADFEVEGGSCLLMELMHCTLECYILDAERSTKTKLSVMLDITQGLSYLHSHAPEVIVHRNLTARKVLLTADDPPVAKIADFGTCRIIDFKSSSRYQSMTEVPGVEEYMAPEACEKDALRNKKLDIFSFGHLSLFTFVQKLKVTLLPRRQSEERDCGDGSYVHPARSEVDRRQEYFEKLNLPTSHPVVTVMKECLSDDPKARPSAEALVRRLEVLSKEHAATHLPSTDEEPEDYPQAKQKVEAAETIGSCHTPAKQGYHFDDRYPGVEFFGEERQAIGLLGGQLSWPTYGISIKVPPNTFQGCIISIRACISGPFNVPDGYSLASPLFLITSSAKFDQEVELRMDHYMHLKCEEDCQQMKFATFVRNNTTYEMNICTGGVFKLECHGYLKCTHFSIRALVVQTWISIPCTLNAKIKASFITTYISDKIFKAIFFMYLDHIWLRKLSKWRLSEKYDCLVWKEEAPPQSVQFDDKVAEVDCSESSVINAQLTTFRCRAISDLRVSTIAKEDVLDFKSCDYPARINCTVHLQPEANIGHLKSSAIYCRVQGIKHSISGKNVEFRVKFCTKKRRSPWYTIAGLGFCCWILLLVFAVLIASLYGGYTIALSKYECTAIENKQELGAAVADVGDWRSLCSNLGVSESKMNALEHSSAQDVTRKRQCLDAFFDLGKDIACWESVANVVASYPIENHRLASKIRNKHVKRLPNIEL